MTNVTPQTSLAALADIHGNALALEAVLTDARQRGLTRFVNLGDIFYGPLDPGATWDILRHLNIPTVLGNQDRILLEEDERWKHVPAFKAAITALGPSGQEWLRSLPASSIIDGDILLCHGTPNSDTTYLLEDIATGLPSLRECAAIENDIFPSANGCSLILAGHSHHPGLANCGNITIVNPGSVGLPAYDDDTPPHIMASGSPHAKYAILTRTEHGWDTEFISVAYDWDTAADMARAGGREDWAKWIATGLA